MPTIRTRDTSIAASLSALNDSCVCPTFAFVVFSGADLAANKVPGFGATPLAAFSVSTLSPAALASVATVKADSDSRADLAVGSGAGQSSLVKIYLGKNLSGSTEPASTSLDPFSTITLNGVFLG